MEKSSYSHGIIIKEREDLEITGVCDVMSFDETSALIKLSGDMGMISLEGEGLHMNEMDSKSGVLRIEGRISGLLYIDRESPKSGLFGKKR